MKIGGLKIFIVLGLAISAIGLVGCQSSPTDMNRETMRLNQDVEYNMRMGKNPYSDVRVPVGGTGYIHMPDQ
jgi:hypothetical protein